MRRSGQLIPLALTLLVATSQAVPCGPASGPTGAVAGQAAVAAQHPGGQADGHGARRPGAVDPGHADHHGSGTGSAHADHDGSGMGSAHADHDGSGMGSAHADHDGSGMGSAHADHHGSGMDSAHAGHHGSAADSGHPAHHGAGSGHGPARQAAAAEADALHPGCGGGDRLFELRAPCTCGCESPATSSTAPGAPNALLAAEPVLGPRPEGLARPWSPPHPVASGLPGLPEPVPIAPTA